MEVADIIDSVDIVEYISQYIELEQRGREYWGLSCFSDEKTPSFSVDPQKRYFMDFSSGKGGNIIEFIKEHDKMSTAEAVRTLKQYAGLNDNITDDAPVMRLEATRIARKYRPQIRNPPKMTAKVLPDNIMSQYEFDKNKLSLWVSEGISLNTMWKFGVRYDAFNDRIVYPIKDYNGKIVSVCGRTCDPDYKSKCISKYTYLQQIGTLDTLYGWSDSVDAIVSKKQVILFEGAKSCMKAYEWGYQNTAALLTSHLSQNQLRFLIRFCSYNNVVILFALDSDIDISKDRNILKLRTYARVQWIKNRDNILEPKESPADRGRNNFEELYQRRESL